MEPTIYKPSIYKGAGIYNTGAEGGGGIVDKFSASPNMTMIGITDVISYGRVKNTSDYQGIFRIPAFNYNNSNYIEYSIKYIIDGFNYYDDAVMVGELWTGSISIDTPLGILHTRTKLQIVINGTTNIVNDLSFSVGDEVRIILKIDKSNSKAIVSLFVNNLAVLENIEWTGINGNLGTREFYVFGLRFPSPATGYNGIATLIFEGTYIKLDGSLVWGME